MKRHLFIALIVCAVGSLPFPVHAQQPAIPVIGFLSSGSPDRYTIRLNAFQQGLKEAGYIESQNVTVEYRWAEGQNARLPTLAAELVHRQVAVLVAGGTPAALAAKAATTSIPIVFQVGTDPVAIGLVASLSRPSGNLTGMTTLNVGLGPKWLELLHQILPAASNVAVLINPSSPAIAQTFLEAIRPAASTFRQQLHVLEASTEPDIDKAFAALSQLRADALVIMPTIEGEKLPALPMLQILDIGESSVSQLFRQFERQHKQIITHWLECRFFYVSASKPHYCVCRNAARPRRQSHRMNNVRFWPIADMS
jgi:ABC-type uncharacterized transport system substrate-binding protein